VDGVLYPDWHLAVGDGLVARLAVCLAAAVAMSRGGDRGRGLRGRRRECDSLEQLATSARAGRSRVLVLRGEAGIGKTALLEYLASCASECRIARATGVESEMELAFAGSTSSAHRSGTDSTAFPDRSATHWGRRSACGTEARPTAS
jgi:hypothetical protein